MELTEEQIEIMGYLTQDKKIKDITEEIYWSKSHVYKIVKQLKNRLKARNTRHLVYLLKNL